MWNTIDLKQMVVWLKEWVILMLENKFVTFKIFVLPTNRIY